MRTTLNIDSDVLQAAKECARREYRTVGQELSARARRGRTVSDDSPGVAGVNVLIALLDSGHCLQRMPPTFVASEASDAK